MEKQNTDLDETTNAHALDIRCKHVFHCIYVFCFLLSSFYFFSFSLLFTLLICNREFGLFSREKNSLFGKFLFVHQRVKCAQNEQLINSLIQIKMALPCDCEVNVNDDYDNNRQCRIYFDPLQNVSVNIFYFIHVHVR